MNMLLCLIKPKSLSLNSELYSYFLTPGFQVGTRNGEKSLNVVTPTQSFENYRLDSAMIEEGMYWISWVNASLSCFSSISFLF